MSVVSVIANLKVDEVYERRIECGARATVAEAKEARRKIKNTLSKAINRARKRQPDRRYHLNIFYDYTPDGRTNIVAQIKRERGVN